MARTTWVLSLASAVAALLLLGSPRATADYVVSAPTVSYYYPPPAVGCYSPPGVYAPAPAVSYYYPPTVTYYAPPPAVAYYPPPVSYYPAPAAAVTTTRYGLFGRPRYSTTRYYAPGYVGP
jgi:hypothetical protein